MVSSQQEPGHLIEEDLVSEPKGRDPRIMWTFLLAFILIVTILWGLGTWQEKLILEKRRADPFLNVTNREFSLFLWQNQEFMRSNVLYKTGYLMAFRSDDNMHLIPELADEYVDAPAEILFRYHVWNYLIEKESLAPRPIRVFEFKQFIEDCQEWLPEYWPYKDTYTINKSKSTKGYVDFINSLKELDLQYNLTDLSYEIFPFEVRLAFQGWKNFFKEIEEIKKESVTVGRVQKFLKDHEKYARNYWQSILEDSYPDYLIAIDRKLKGEELTSKEVSPFLKIALFNFSK